ncbi:MAG: DUF3160 domain-containing protein [Spirochaetales bacterium]|nr:DUF3160 domain-containing protein [Spirochaetales bacterium]
MTVPQEDSSRETTAIGTKQQRSAWAKLAADVHTYSYENWVVKEAVGNVDLILIACPSRDGSVFPAAGCVLSYYEFKHPMDDRLTDEAWRYCGSSV